MMSFSGGPMTEAMYYVLLALTQPNYGYQLMQSIQQISNGRIEMGPGTLYGVLTRMEKDGFIRVAGTDGRRKTYEITAHGKLALKTEYARLCAMIEDSKGLEGL